ncbi:hypothetical protein [Mucilaginibacter sp. PAMB04168]|uniref:NADase-type glycan-binding domain-containing protein n=1 Tax=Mucilaginibacter sp. PAMB04168 TaxID=3138567 RepID=UPI0031F60A44
MKVLFCILFLFTNPIPWVHSYIDRSSDYFEKSINGYKKNEFWGNWSMPLSETLTVSTVNKAGIHNQYNKKNIQDYNLNTAYVFENFNNTSDAYIEFVFKYPANTSYSSAYQFQGICNLFNGYCKSDKTWKENARIKSLLIYFNDQPVCNVNLKDTWHYQSFDLSKLFVNKRANKNLKARYEIKNGDRLKFKIVSVYPGTKYADVAISEFLCEGAPN